MKPRVLQCAIEDLFALHPSFYVEPYIVAFVAVTGQYSVPPASFLVECTGVRTRWLGKARRFKLEVSWTEETIDKAERLRTTMPARSLVEFAAIAVALLLVNRVVQLGTLNVIEHGGRADYRSSVLQRVLEISGTESLADLGRRHRQKIAQALSNPFGWDAYVIVCAFCGEGHHVHFSGHRWEESPYAQA
ncbi:MAG: hypothetical protein L0Y71_04955 [Gemmataceae bacterium]|nr:hypothetical protein [Gemmataceae bacterium]